MTAPLQRRAERPDPVLLLGLLLGGLLLFWNLGRDALWTDEAESMLLARSITENGLPVAFDGHNYITQSAVARRADFNDDLIWVLTPWAQLYMGAASFLAFGVSNLSARLPFALVGLLTLWMLYRVTLRLTADRATARVALALACTSFTLLLHARQARYYSLAMFAGLWVLDAYLSMREARRSSSGREPATRGAWSMTLALTLLFHANYGLFIPVAAGLVLHGILFGRGQLAGVGVARVAVGTLLLTAPWALYARIGETRARLEMASVFEHGAHYLHAINNFALPLGILAAGLVLACVARGGDSGPRAAGQGRAGLGLIAIIVLLQIGFVALNAGYFTRYIINLIPLLILVHAVCLTRIARAWSGLFSRRDSRGAPDHSWATRGAQAFGWCIVPLAMFTNVLAQPAQPLLSAPAQPVGSAGRPVAVQREFDSWRSDFWELCYELQHDYDGPLEGLSEFLAANVDAGDQVFIPWGFLPLDFYLERVEIRGIRQGVPFTGQADWVVSRGSDLGGWQNNLRRQLLAWGYEPIALPRYRDTRWQNRPDPYLHLYRTPTLRERADDEPGSYPPVLIFMAPWKTLRFEEGALLGREAVNSQVWGL